MIKCEGCGVILDNNKDEIGYSSNIETRLCERCFRIKHYNEYKSVDISYDTFVKSLDEINENELIILLVDLLDIPSKMDFLKKFKNILLVMTKKDLLPKSVKDFKLIDYMDSFGIKFVDKLVISSLKNYNLDLLMEKISKYQTSKNVYVVGYTNSGKSTMINKIIKNYSSVDMELTTSMMPSTTLGNLEININDNLTLIDTPGIIDSGNITNYLDAKTLKNLVVKKTIRPVTYQVKNRQYFKIDDFLKIDIDNNNITLFMSNQLILTRYFNDFDMEFVKKYSFKVTPETDIVIRGLGFIKVTKKGNIDIYSRYELDIFLRKSLI